MIRSMTGYGSAKGHAGAIPLSVEVRSVNNRYFDINVKTPKGFLFIEPAVRSFFQEKVSRGKLDVLISVDASENELTHVRVNENLAAEYYAAILQIGNMLHLQSGMNAADIARLQDVLSIEKPETDQNTFLEELMPILSEALNDFNQMRCREGEKLRDDILNKADLIEHMVSDIERQAPLTLNRYKERLRMKLSEILSDRTVTEDRILLEAAVFADRIATDEETVRLRSHLAQLHAMLQEGSPIGRKLDFLIQECNREANTIGSKCQDSDIAYLVVNLKAEIEKIREQIQNIE